MTKFLLLLPYYIRVIWGITLGFCGIGLIMHKPAAIYSTVCLLAAWLALRIIGETIEAVSVIQAAKKIDLTQSPPPPPPAE